MTREETLRDGRQFPAWRKEIISQLEDLANSPDRHTYLRNLIFANARDIAQKPGFSPACRYNLTLIIGDLNETEAQRGDVSGQAQPAVPMAQARKWLLEIVNSPQQPQALKIAALIGLNRHVKCIAAVNPKGIDRDFLKAMVTVAQGKSVAADGSLDGTHWMRRIAVDSLGAVGHTAAAPILNAILTDASLPGHLRCAAASTIGQLDYQPTSKVAAAPIVKGLGQFALSACQRQIEQLRSNTDSTRLESDFRPTSSDEPQEAPSILRVRRQLKYELQSVDDGLKGLQKANLDAATKTALEALRGEVGALLKALDPNPAQTPQDLIQKLSQPFVRLEKVASK
jgi:hypothetical protein